MYYYKSQSLYLQASEKAANLKAQRAAVEPSVEELEVSWLSHQRGCLSFFVVSSVFFDL